MELVWKIVFHAILVSFIFHTKIFVPFHFPFHTMPCPASVISAYFICKYQNEVERNRLCCSMQRQSMSRKSVPIVVNRLDCATSQLRWSVDLLSHRFQIFLICGNLIDCSGRRYKYLLIITCFCELSELFWEKNDEINK